MALDFDLALSIVESQLQRQAKLAETGSSKRTREVVEESADEEAEQLRKLEEHRANYRAFRDQSSIESLSGKTGPSTLPNQSSSKETGLHRTESIDQITSNQTARAPLFADSISSMAAQESDSKKQPDLGYLVLQLGLKKFEQIDTTLRKITQEVEKEEEKVAHLLNLRKQLNKFPEGKKFELTPESRELISKLEDLGVKLLDKDLTKLTQGQFLDLKSQIDSCMTQARTRQQTLFTTKLNVALTDRNTLLEEMKTILRTNDRLKEFIIEKSARL